MSDGNWEPEVRSDRDGKYRPVSVCGWLGTLFVSILPGINLILWIIWAFLAKKPSRKSFARAALLLLLILVVLSLVALWLYGEEILKWIHSLDPELFLPAAP